MNDFKKLFKAMGIKGVFAHICEYKTLKTRSEKTLVLSLDSSFGADIVSMSNGDIPSYLDNEVPVVVIPVNDFQKLAEELSSKAQG